MRRAAALAACLLLAACRGGADDAPRLYAAASLAPAVEALPAAGCPAHAAVVAGTPLLVRQVREGAAPGVLLAADSAWADALAADGLVAPGGRVDLLANALVVIVPDGSSLALDSLADLARADVARLALADTDSVPVGRYARAALEGAGVWDAVAPRVVAVADARAVVALVARGEADAGIAYASDARTAGVVAALDVPEELHPPVRYPLLLLTGAPEPARALFDWLRGDAAARVFRAHGLRPVPR